MLSLALLQVESDWPLEQAPATDPPHGAKSSVPSVAAASGALAAVPVSAAPDGGATATPRTLSLEELARPPEAFAPGAIAQALAGSDGHRMMLLHHELGLCDTIQRLISATPQLRATRTSADEVARLTADLQYLQAVERGCQRMTESERADAQASLSWRALELGHPNSAASYFSSVRRKVPPDRLTAVLAGLQADAADGDGLSLAYLARFGATLGLSAIERRAYELASIELQTREGVFDDQVPEPLVPVMQKLKTGTPLDGDDELVARSKAAPIIAKLPPRPPR